MSVIAELLKGRHPLGVGRHYFCWWVRNCFSAVNMVIINKAKVQTFTSGQQEHFQYISIWNYVTVVSNRLLWFRAWFSHHPRFTNLFLHTYSPFLSEFEDKFYSSIFEDKLCTPGRISHGTWINIVFSWISPERSHILWSWCRQESSYSIENIYMKFSIL